MKRLLATILLGISTAAAGQTQVPNTFQAGTPARADEVNANFATVTTAVDNNAQDIANSAGLLAGVSQNVSGNTQNIAANTQNIAANTQNIDTVTQSLASMTTPQEFRFVGFSTAEVDGGAGFFGMAAACQADFGPDSRLATSKEIAESTVQPVLNASHAWVHPVLVVIGGSLYDYTGFENPGSCNGWQETSGSYLGTAMGLLPDGGFEIVGCSTARPVACSALQ